ncbi:type VI secretion system Vgr family protein [Aquimarina rhabdastrellae]
MKPAESQVIISIGGENLHSFEELRLNQQMQNHHEFELWIDADVKENEGSFTLDRAQTWLGKTIVITQKKQEFIGIVTQLKMVQTDGHHSLLHLKGYSKTILLDKVRKLKSWREKDLESIIKEVLQQTTFAKQIRPNYRQKINYQAQYQETNFQFLQRLAQEYHDWLYYDGKQLNFGKPKEPEAVSIEYGKEITEMKIGIDTTAPHQDRYSYDSMNHTMHRSNSNKNVEGLNELAHHAFETSKEMYPDGHQGYLWGRTKHKGELDQAVESEQSALAANLHTIEAKSSQKDLTVGSIIKIQASRYDMKSFEIKPLGEYIITQINHHFSGRLEYENQFKAVPAGIVYLPNQQYHRPQAHSQLAEVISNADPMGKGRIQVQMQWQTGDMKTAWIRVLTPNAGSSSNHSRNRGQVFIPEVGDQVMVGFRYNDPNRPFVMGSVYHGTNGSGGKHNNNYKSIITRSGHVVEFNDTDKAESITITDRKGNNLVIDTAGESITINALKDITINAGENINITAGKNIIVNAGDNIDENAGKNISSRAGKDILQNASGDIKEKSNNIIEIADKDYKRESIQSDVYGAKVTINSIKEDIDILSSKTVNINASEKSNLF